MEVKVDEKALFITLLFTLLTTSMAPVNAVDLKSAKNQKSSVDNRISTINANKKKVLAEKAKLEKQQKQVANAQAAESNAYQELLSQISEAEENLRQTEIALSDAQADYNAQYELVKTRLRIMYENSSASKLDTLLESKSFVEFYERKIICK